LFRLCRPFPSLMGRRQRTDGDTRARRSLTISVVSCRLTEPMLYRVARRPWVVRSVRWRASRSDRRIHRRSGYLVQPRFGPRASTATYCDGCSAPYSRTIRTSRSSNSGECRLGRPRGSSQTQGPSENPVTTHRSAFSCRPESYRRQINVHAEQRIPSAVSEQSVLLPDEASCPNSRTQASDA
jgi:hypothetical protein